MSETGMSSKLERAVRQRIVEYNRDLDETCEKAIRHQCGVKVIWGPGLSYEMMVDSEVPFGQVHEVHPEGIGE